MRTSENTKPIEIALTEYRALREEILMRLKAQQDLLRYTILVGALLPPLLGLSEIISPGGFLALILVGPILCIFIQGVYLKQHLFVALLADYITAELGKEIVDIAGDRSVKLPQPKIGLLAGWEIYLTKTLYQRTLTNFLSGLLDLFEGTFPLLMGVLYLFAFGLAAWNSRSVIPCIVEGLLWLACFLEALVLLFFVAISYWIWRWVGQLRKAIAKVVVEVEK